MPGLTVDVYGDILVAEFNTAGLDLWKNEIVSALKKHFPAHAVFERSDSDLRIKEGLEASIGVLAGEGVSEKIEVLENGLRFFVDVKSGQKTGFFLDQRDNRAIAGKLAKNKKVLNAFAYTGGFSVYAAAGGAKETVSVDISEQAVELGKKNFEVNGISSERNKWIKADVFEFLRKDESEFDFIVLDPPAFCKHKAQTNQAARGYKDINLQAIKKMAPGGLLFTFSCSSFISADLFQKIIFSSASDAKRDVRILRKTSHPFDHPINIYHPEGEYLKGLLCEVL